MQGSGFRRYSAYGLGLGTVSTGCSQTEILSTEFLGIMRRDLVSRYFLDPPRVLCRAFGFRSLVHGCF